MHAPRILAAGRDGIAGFERREAGRVSLWVDPELAESAGSLGLLLPDGLERALAAAPAAHGRAATAVLALPGRGERLHLRPVRHGGWLAGLWGRWLLGPGRALGELAATAALRARGAPVPRPILAVARRRGPCWEVAVGTEHQEGSRDLAVLLASRPGGAALRRVAVAAGHAVRRFHDAGGRHADLHVKNLIWRESRGDVLVVDLDRGRAGAPPDAARRARELMRLYRSLRKRGLAERVGVRGCAAFFGAYVGRDRALRRALRARLGRERLRVAVHALGYGRSG